jgi:hypothetical protein
VRQGPSIGARLGLGGSHPQCAARGWDKQDVQRRTTVSAALDSERDQQYLHYANSAANPSPAVGPPHRTSGDLFVPTGIGAYRAA